MIQCIEPCSLSFGTGDREAGIVARRGCQFLGPTGLEEQGTGRDGLGEDTGMQLSQWLTGKNRGSRGCGAMLGMEAGGIPKGAETADAING